MTLYYEKILIFVKNFKNSSFHLKRFISTYNKIKIIPKSVLFRKLIKFPFKKRILELNEKSFQKSIVGIGSINFNKDSLSYYQDLFRSKEEIICYSQGIVNSCDQICEHVFDLLGSGPHKVSNDSPEHDFYKAKLHNPNLTNHLDNDYKFINWNLDFKSGFEWNVKSKSELLTYDELPGVDVKVPWEIGRMQHLIMLCYAAVLEKDSDKYLSEYTNEIIDFIYSNPLGYGIQWKSSMDVSIRGINILLSYCYLKLNSVNLNYHIEKAIARTLFEHLLFILHNPEWNDGLRGNHYFFNITALLVLSSFFEDKQCEQILNITIHKFFNEMDYQFNDDGSNFEASVHYHFFTTEAVTLCKLIIDKLNIENKINIPQNFNNKLDKIYKFCLANINENNEIFRIGDNDGGYLLKLHPEDRLTKSLNNYKHVIRLINKKELPKEILKYENFGLYIIKQENYDLLFRCGSVGQKGKGGHAHNDQLSLTLSVFGLQFFVDPGTFCYTSDFDKRNKFRSSAYHNTLIVEGFEQNLLTGYGLDDLFWLPDKAKAKLIGLRDSYIEGVHFGYKSPHYRSVNFSTNEIIIKDECDVDSDKGVLYHLHPNVNISVTKKNEIKLSRERVQITFIVENGDYSIEDYEFSPDYGMITNSKRILTSANDKTITTKIILGD